MKPRICSYCFFLCIFLLPIISAHAQLTTVGKEFWVGFMDNNTDGQNGRAVIVISANETAQGTIDMSAISDGLTYSFDLQKGESYTMRIPEYDLDLLHRDSGQKENKGIFISSTGKVSVFAFNERFKSADGTVVLPKRTLGKDYLVTSHYEITPNTTPGVEMNINDESTLLVVGVEDNTKVEITPSVGTVDGKPGGISFDILLDAGESYQLKAKGDLTGSRVRVRDSQSTDCKNIAVFGGNKWTGVGECGSAPDHLFQQMYPLSTWGKEYTHIPLKTRSSGELVKVLAAEDGTEISVNGQVEGVIDAGEWIPMDVGADEVATIRGSKDISVTAFSKSRNCNTSGDPFYALGDPFMMALNPSERLLEDVTFESMDIVQITHHFLNVTVKTSVVGDTRLDGQSIAGEFQHVPGNSDYSYARISVSGGVHRLTNPAGFIAYAYGFGDLESYGYAVGANLENLAFSTDTHYDFEVIGENVTCLNEEFTWEIVPDNPAFDYFTWNIEGSDAAKSGEAIQHTFESPGIYQVTIYASDGPTTCDHVEEVRFEVEVIATSAALEGVDFVCEGMEPITYEASQMENIDHFEWEVEGGELIASEGNTATVRWDLVAENAAISLLPFTAEGCPGLAITKAVTVWDPEMPPAPDGPAEICFDAPSTSHYQVTDTEEKHQYQWHTEGGDIISSNNGEEVEVKWNASATNRKIWYEAFHEEVTQCRVVSEVLEVEMLAAISVVETIQDVSCHGGSTGEISVEVTGGRGPYSYSWRHDDALDSPVAEGLEPGNYQVTITDALGCQLVYDDLPVGEPDQLRAEVTSNPGTSCYESADAEVTIKAIGGMPPYRIDRENAMVAGDEIRLESLEAGKYDFTIFDSNDCHTNMEVEVSKPSPLKVEVEVLRRSCPGESGGELLAVPTGGTSPYLFTWDYGANTNAELTGVPKGEYTVTVQDDRGCIGFGSASLHEVPPEVRMPTGYDPSGEGVNRIYRPVSSCPVEFTLKIYNRWGELIYSGSQGWDGSVDGEMPANDAYTYFLEYYYTINGNQISRQKRGMFTVVK
ncbi:hypothetical protein DN752_01575 [Echinicola strongylocentroti]|uniref:PKD domain-containing protein n=1 Tax=Echinicola strongylocentroti TaxID=1795355 RepID=A0A2Z4IDH2_9BACT|nr:gliding motility-associated C-terminal domain-containing protein [Echinicola strongylocentroti]AWW28924.1 hypothetical protein DN752_01575 [Echinicola strongylocentroti]